MDDVLEENLNNHALPEQKEMARKYRNVGIGIMGLHDAIIKLNLVYGSPEAVKFTHHVQAFIFRLALDASVNLAKERGSFPGYNSSIWDSEIIKKNVFIQNISKYKEIDKLRNCSLLSVAPTGSIGTMFGVSTGCEPFFALEYYRRTVSLNGEETYYKCDYPVVKAAKEHHCDPKILITANDINPLDRINMQQALQDATDTAISSTINLPKGTTPSQIESIYKYAWKKGLKGVTVYVDGSRDPILSKNKNTTTNNEVTSIKPNSVIPISRKDMGKMLHGCTQKFNTACGTLYVTINFDSNGNPVEIFTNSSKNGTCKANLNGETRMASLALRCGCSTDEVIDQLKSIHCQACAFMKAKGKHIDGTSCPDIIAKALMNVKKNNNTVITEKDSEYDECPECHKKGLIHNGGCKECKYCGYSACSL